MSTPEPGRQSHRSGFDVILGNPPWERVKLQEQEFFAQRDPTVAGASNAAARKKAIAALSDTNPELLAEFQEATRRAEGESHLMRSSGRYPLCGRGDINTYAVFAESMRDGLSRKGRLGVIVPTGIATDDTTKFYFGDLIDSSTLASLISFENEGMIFPSVHHFTKFCLLTVTGASRGTETPIDLVFYARTIEAAFDPAKRFQLAPSDIVQLNPNTKTCAIFRSARDAEITKAIYHRVPVLIREGREGHAGANPWGLTFMAMFHMANASELFIAPEVACPAIRKSLATDSDATPPYLPLYEAKMLHQFDHRWATYAREDCDWLSTPIRTRINKDGRAEPDARDATTVEKDSPAALAAPRYWVTPPEVENRLIKTDQDDNVVWAWEQEWLVGWRDISNAVNERTVIAGIIPRVGVGHTIPLMFPKPADAKQASCLIACMNSFVVDYAARQKIGGTHLTYGFLNQFPVLTPSAFAAPCAWDDSTALVDWIAPRVLELVYTAHDLAAFARDLDYDGPPFRWDAVRRAQIRAELDAAFFHLYGVNRDDAAYIMDTFLVFKARDEERNGGVYETKDAILAVYDAMTEAMSEAPSARPSVAVPAPVLLPPTRTQVQKGRAPAYITLLAATWAKPVERQAVEYGLVLMLNDALRAKVLAHPLAGAKAGLFPTSHPAAGASQPSPAPATEYVQGLDAMIGLLDANNVLKVTTSGGHGGMQRIELGSKGAAMAQSLPQADRAKAKEAVTAFEILKTNLLPMESFAATADLEFSVT